MLHLKMLSRFGYIKVFKHCSLHNKPIKFPSLFPHHALFSLYGTILGSLVITDVPSAIQTNVESQNSNRNK